MNTSISNTTLVKCQFCGRVPLIIDVGGNNPHYEISCTCDKGIVVNAETKRGAISIWNIFNHERVVNNG